MIRRLPNLRRKKVIGLAVLTWASCLFSLSCAAADASYPLDHIEPDIHDQASLQRGAKTYINYCMGCHSLGYQRYKRTAEDLGIPENLMLKHLVFDPRYPNRRFDDKYDERRKFEKLVWGFTARSHAS